MNQDPTDLAGIAETSDEDARQRQAQQARERDDFRWLMAHAQGRRIVWRYLGAGGVFRTTHVFGDINGRDSALNEGRRQIALQLLDDVMTHTPAAYAKMVDESAQPIE
jgi:hypothetical protein